jgi:acetyl esterase/lipase
MRFSAALAALALVAGISADSPAMTADAKPIMTWPDLLSRPKPTPDRTLRYGDDPLQVVDLWLPKGKGPHPVVLMIHGGCWLSDVADRSIMGWISDDLRGQGIAVWNIDYRGVDRPGGGYPGTFMDVAAAADMLARDGKTYGLKTDRIVAVGHSAGGHLALWLAARSALPTGSALRGARPAKIHAAISQGGLPDLKFSSNTVGHGCGTDGARAMAGAISADRPDIYADTSPIAMVPGTARQIQVNTTRDPIAPPSYAAAYEAALKMRGLAVHNVAVPGEGHVELIAPGSAAWATTVPLIKGALRLR